jgi:methyl-accepting chemotaxis protein
VSTARSQRKTLKWLNPDFQRRYSLYLLGIVFSVSAVLLTCFWYFADRMLLALIESQVVSEQMAIQFFARHVEQLILTLSIAVVVYVVVLLVVATLLTSRIVGPLFALKRGMESLANGDWESARVRLRENDEFQDVAEAFNKAIDKIQSSR